MHAKHRHVLYPTLLLVRASCVVVFSSFCGKRESVVMDRLDETSVYCNSSII